MTVTNARSVRLSNVEAQRMVALLDETLEKMRLFSFAASRDGKGLDCLAEGSVPSAAITEHMRIEQRYLDLLESEDVNEEIDDELDQLAQTIHESTRDTLRVVKRDPNAVASLYHGLEVAQPQPERTGDELEYDEYGEPISAVSGGGSGGLGGSAPGHGGLDADGNPREDGGEVVPGAAALTDEEVALNDFLTTLQELREVTYKRLVTTAEEERSRWEFVAEIMEKEKKASQEVKNLQRDLAVEKKSREKNVSAKNEIIDKLKEELHEIRTLTAERNRALEKQIRDRLATDQTEFQAKEGVLKENTERLTHELDSSLQDNRSQEESLRKRKFRNEQEVENWIQKYDADMEQRTTEFEDLKDRYSREKKQLAEYEEHYAALHRLEEAEAARVANERLQRENRVKQWKKLHDSAARIQAMYRGSRVRRLFRERFKKKKGKGKKRKGKGKRRR